MALAAVPTGGWAVWGRPLLVLAALLFGPLLLGGTPFSRVATSWAGLLLLAFWLLLMAGLVGGLAGASQSPLNWLEGHLRRWVAWFAPDPEALWLAWAREAHRPATALHCLEQAVRRGGAEACFQEGLVFLEGGFGPGGQAAAVHRFRKAAARGHAEAGFRLAEALRTGLGSPTPDAAEGLAWYQRAARAGFGPAAAWLAQAYATGDGVAPDDDLARHWAREAAAGQPHPPLSRSLLRYDAAPQDPLVRLQGAFWQNLEGSLGRAVGHRLGRGVLGVLVACLGLGALTVVGLFFWTGSSGLYHLPLIMLAVPGVMLTWQAIRLGRERPSQRRDRLREAADRGESEACFQLGLRYQQGTHRQPKDDLEAARWFRKAAEAGHPGAMAALGQAYLGGHGVLRDPRAAAHWNEAARRGSTS